MSSTSNRRDANSDAMWCWGPLMLNSWDGEEMLIWNPYSLEDLLSIPGIDTYLECLDAGRGGCTSPNLPLLARQGAQAMQVIGRCRANFQQKQWDEGAVLLGLFTPAEWYGGLDAAAAAASTVHRKHRMRMVALMHDFKVVGRRPDRAVVQCFHAAMAQGLR